MNAMISSTESDPEPSRSAAANSSSKYARSSSDRDASAAAKAWLSGTLDAPSSSYVVIACVRTARGAYAQAPTRPLPSGRCARLDVIDRFYRRGAHPRQTADGGGAGEDSQDEEVEVVRGARAQLVDRRVDGSHGDVLAERRRR